MGGVAFIFMRAIFSTRHAHHVITGTFLLLLLSSSYWSCPVVVTRRGTVTILCFYLSVTFLLMPARTSGTIFSFTRLSAAKSASHNYISVFSASHCRTYYNTKLLQLSASSWLLTVFGLDAAITTTIAPATHRWC